MAITQYFKKKLKTYQILVQVNPEDYSGVELIIHPDGTVEKTYLQFDEDIFDDLAEDEFEEGSVLEFQLLLKKTES